jgi:PadR family transcriptional regulator PadR
MSVADEPMLLAGTLDLLVLRTLTWGPRHGYAVARWINETSRDAIAVEDRALYLSLHRLEDRGLIVSEWALSENNRRAKFYELTAEGRRQLRIKERAFTHYVDAVFQILKAPERSAAR